MIFKVVYRKKILRYAHEKNSVLLPALFDAEKKFRALRQKLRPKLLKQIFTQRRLFKEHLWALSTMMPWIDKSIMCLDFDEMIRWRLTFLGDKRLDRSGCEEKDSVTLDGNETSQISFEVKSFDGLMFFSGKIQ